MAKNRVQFQKGLSLDDFAARYGTEEQCRQALFKMRWPQGFRCPCCGGERHCEIKGRHVYQCAQCRHQTSLIAGTIFQATKLPLRVWFLAIYLLTQSKNGVSSLELARHLGVAQYTAWGIKHKLMQVMLERENHKPLTGRIELDDAYWGGERHQHVKRGRGAPGKTPFLAAVETTPSGKPVRMKLTRVPGFRKRVITRWGQKHLLPGCEVVSDGLSSFTGVRDAGCQHQPIVVGSGPSSVKHPAFRWVNTMLGNVKNAITGTYHAVSAKHLPRYLAEFQYRFNRRYHLEEMIPRLVYAAARTSPMPQRLLALAEVP